MRANACLMSAVMFLASALMEAEAAALSVQTTPRRHPPSSNMHSVPMSHKRRRTGSHNTQAIDKRSSSNVVPISRHHNLAKQSTFDSIAAEEPTIFERAFRSEVDEAERRALAKEEGWYTSDGLDEPSFISVDPETDVAEQDGQDAEAATTEAAQTSAPSVTQAPEQPLQAPLQKQITLASSPIIGLVGYDDELFGPSGATRKVTRKSGPNGSQEWLNHGISRKSKRSRWRPPHVKLSQLKTVSLSRALKNENSPFHACEPYLSLINSAAKRHNLPPIVLASLAMQESSCAPAPASSSAGAFGIMQIITENCKGRSPRACAEPRFNIDTAAKVFSDTLRNSGGDILATIGSWNGWWRGMNYRAATKDAEGPCCECQQNLDYLHQMVNGWFLGIDPHARKLGVFRNLDACL